MQSGLSAQIMATVPSTKGPDQSFDHEHIRTSRAKCFNHLLIFTPAGVVIREGAMLEAHRGVILFSPDIWVTSPSPPESTDCSGGAVRKFWCLCWNPGIKILKWGKIRATRENHVWVGHMRNFSLRCYIFLRILTLNKVRGLLTLWTEDDIFYHITETVNDCCCSVISVFANCCLSRR